MLQIPPQFLQSTKSSWKHHAMLYSASSFGFLILFSIEEGGSFSLDDVLSAGIFVLVVMSGTRSIYIFPDDQHIQALMGYKFILIPLMLGTVFMTGLNTFCAVEFSAHGRRRNCGFSFAYAAFMRGTLEGVISGIFGVLVGAAFIYLALQNIIFTRQAYNLYRRFRDEHYRRRG